MGVEADAIFTPDVSETPSFRIGSHKLESTRVLSHVRGLDVRSHTLPPPFISILSLLL